jgi:hypothetical protein
MNTRQNREYSFQKQLWRELNERYHAHGAFWQNTTYSHGNHHDPFPCVGAGDLIGCLDGRWIEIELKTSTGRWRDMQKVRKGLVERCGGIYVVVREGQESDLYRILDALAPKEGHVQ